MADWTFETSDNLTAQTHGGRHDKDETEKMTLAELWKYVQEATARLTRDFSAR